jgi:UDP-N-acetylmuramoyl-L-alanyl-D-glutamate--2,6-diaminopimelate ligase
MTTPPAIELSRTLATMVEQRCEAVAMEVSSHALDQGRASALDFDAAVFTNLTGDHLDYHNTNESYRDAKGLLFEGLDSESVAVFARGIDANTEMAQRCKPSVEQRWCVVEGDDDWAISIVAETIDGMVVSVRTPSGEFESSTKLLGRYNALNLIESIAAADVLLGKLDVGAEERMLSYKKTLAGIALPAGRLERVDDFGDRVRVFVDFAHTDAALRTTLNGIRPLLDQTSRLWVVFGCGGDRDSTKRPRMGSVAVGLADRVVVTSDNPRTEKPSRIVDEILEGIEAADRIYVEVQIERSQAIHHAIASAEEGDVIIIAGKGHETEQIVPSAMGGVSSFHFDDREHARAALRERRLRFPSDGGQ